MSEPLVRNRVVKLEYENSSLKQKVQDLTEQLEGIVTRLTKLEKPKPKAKKKVSQE